MKFDTLLLNHDLRQMAEYAQIAEQMGFDGLWTAETQNDPFLPLVLAAEHSQKLTLGTSIAVAFPRSPATLAYMAWDLARYSNGRFILGLGTQVKAHNVFRFGVRWEKPVKKLRETILAMRAFWDCWQNDQPLAFEGEFFNLKLMTPFFNPGPIETPHIPIYIAAVNEQMLRLAGELCEGVHLHALHTVKYLQEYALPHLETGMVKNGRSRSDLTLSTGLFVIPTDDVKPAHEHEAFVRQQIAFYLSTPAYKVVADLHGWQAIAQQLSQHARNGDWSAMPNLINDEMLDAFAVTATWGDLAHKINAKYGDLLDRVSYYLPFTPGENDAGWQATLASFKQLG